MGLLDALQNGGISGQGGGLLQLVGQHAQQEQPQRSPQMALRPFKADEHVNNPDGSISTERTVTVQTPDGGYANVPSLWMGPHGPVDLAKQPDPENVISSMMQMYEAQNGPTWQRFKDIPSAVDYAKNRSKNGGAASGLER